jgi:hypothetical protein
VNNDVTVLVSISATDDFEVARPKDTLVNLMLNPPVSSTNVEQNPPILDSVLAPSPSLVAAPVILESTKLDIQPQSAIDEVSTHKTYNQGSMTHFTLGPNQKPHPDLMKMHFGESIVSFRSVLKKYMLHEVIDLKTVTNQTHRFAVVRQNWPFLGGRVLAGGPKSINYGPPGVWEPAWFPMIQYVTLGFAGWRGSIRYMLDTSNGGTVADLPSPHPGANPSFNLVVNTLNFDLGYTFSGSFVERTLITVVDRTLDLFDICSRFVSQTNTLVYSPATSGTHKWEIPYQMPWRFAPAKFGFHTNAVNPYQNIWEMEFLQESGPRAVPHFKYVAAGEDYTCLFYTGPPIFYFRNTAPNSIP